jgi:hypothetical protein
VRDRANSLYSCVILASGFVRILSFALSTTLSGVSFGQLMITLTISGRTATATAERSARTIEKSVKRMLGFGGGWWAVTAGACVYVRIRALYRSARVSSTVVGCRKGA